MEPVGLVVLLLVAGLIFLAVEIFVLPGFGVAGVIGLLLLVGGSIAAWLLLGSTWGAAAVAVILVLTVAIGVLAFRSRALKKRLVLDTALPHGGGTASADLTGLVGSLAEAVSDLRPAGIVLVDGNRVDVVSEGGFVEKGSRVKITAVDGPRVVVAKLE
jgi:membrane-bound serine protease (ClpP class)